MGWCPRWGRLPPKQVFLTLRHVTELFFFDLVFVWSDFGPFAVDSLWLRNVPPTENEFLIIDDFEIRRVRQKCVDVMC